MWGLVPVLVITMQLTSLPTLSNPARLRVAYTQGIDHCRDASLCSGPTVIAGSCASIPAMYGGVYGGYGGYGGHTCQCAPGFKDYDPATNTCTGK